MQSNIERSTGKNDDGMDGLVRIQGKLKMSSEWWSAKRRVEDLNDQLRACPYGPKYDALSVEYHRAVYLWINNIQA